MTAPTITNLNPRRRGALPPDLDRLLLATEGCLLRDRRPDQYGLIGTYGGDCLDVTVSRARIGQAMSIVKAFLKLLHRTGYTVRIGEQHPEYPTFAVVDGEEQDNERTPTVAH